MVDNQEFAKYTSEGLPIVMSEVLNLFVHDEKDEEKYRTFLQVLANEQHGLAQLSIAVFESHQDSLHRYHFLHKAKKTTTYLNQISSLI